MAEFSETLGFEDVSAADGECVIGLEVAPSHLSRADRVHGGVLFALLDSALGRAILTKLPEGRGCATVECKINYFRPVQKGRLTTVARVLNMTRNTAYAEGSITNEDGKLVARASGTFFLTDTMVQSERERV